MEERQGKIVVVKQKIAQVKRIARERIIKDFYLKLCLKVNVRVGAPVTNRSDSLMCTKQTHRAVLLIKNLNAEKLAM
ncbi:hypothetical protein AV656_08250 [Bhargavaea cecembensis]|uniref:Uncharacterized protein n=1 Tax=Bhargavaea cecembensis TaxID=394098 RepID=A0A163FKX4_9BACL|nr:hypothetical protein AV656_08250 [Bhargavaea cecembensis]